MNNIENSYELAKKIGGKGGLNCITALDSGVVSFDEKSNSGRFLLEPCWAGFCDELLFPS